MEQNKERNKGGRPKKEATEKLKYRVAVKMATADYYRLLTRAHEAGVSPSEYHEGMFLQRSCERTAVGGTRWIHPPALWYGEQSQPACAQGKRRRLSR